MDTPLNALQHFLCALRAFRAAGTPRFLDISRQFTAHLFSPWIPNSARGIDGGPRQFTVGSLTSSSQRLRVQSGPGVTFMVSLPGLGDQSASRSRLVSRLLLLLKSLGSPTCRPARTSVTS